MARRGSEDGKDKKKADRGAEKKSEQEGEDQEQATEKKVESETSRAQNQLGNQALAAMMAAQQGAGGRGSSVEVEMAKRKADTEKEGQEFGGDDEAADPPILLDDDLTESWNPSTTAPGDRTGFLEEMPEDELPPEDPDFLTAIRQVRDVGRLPSSNLNEALVQPSAEVLAISAQGWARGVARFAGPALHQRAWARLLKVPGAILQDPHGRVLLLRARSAALAANALLAGPALANADVARCAVIDFALELESRDWRTRSGRVALGDNTVRAQARGTLALVIGEGEGRVRPRLIEPIAFRALTRSLEALLTMDDPHGLVPQITESIAVPDAEEDDDPLGLDEVMAEMTGGARDPREAPYRAFLQAADRVATSIYITRVRAAGVAAAVADVAHLWSAGAPEASLLDAMGALDAETTEIVSLLKDVARAANKRTVALPTLRAWLDQAATKLVAARDHAIAAMAMVIGGILPGDPRLPDISDGDVDDPLADAWADGQPLRAVRWLRSLPASFDRDAAIAFTRLAGEYDPAVLVADLCDLRARAQAAGSEPLADAFGIGVGAAWLHLGQYQDAIALGEERAHAAIQRRNGIVAAEAILLQVEGWLAAGDPDRAAAVRLRGGAIVWQLGARGGLTLLARWRAPDREDQEDPV